MRGNLEIEMGKACSLLVREGKSGGRTELNKVKGVGTTM